MTEETKFTVFATGKSGRGECMFASAVRERPEEQSLEGLIQFVADYEGAHIPVAWAPEANDTYGGTKHADVLRAESIAAGRLIEHDGTRYVARGVEDKPAKAKTLGDLLLQALDRGIGKPATMTPTLDKLANTSEPKRPRLTWADTKPFDPFPGFIVTKGRNADDLSDPEPFFDNLPKSTAHPALSSLSLSADLAPSSHQVLPGFGSASLVKR